MMTTINSALQGALRAGLIGGLVAGLIGAAPLSPVLAEASVWRINPETSTINITFDVDNAPRQGVFEAFRGEARFDPDALEEANLRFEIETASIDLDEPFATDFVKSIDWLFVEEHPVAIYDLQRLERIKGDRFRAIGLLTLRGRTHPVVGELTLALGENDAAASGKAGFDRKDFNVGVGFSTLFVEIGPEIGVSFDLKATKVE